MKLFPASCGGPGYLRALRGPFPTAALVPTGGVRIDEIRAYLDAGATVVALGSELVGRSAPRSDSDLEWIAVAGRPRDVRGARRRALAAGCPLMRLDDLETPALTVDLDAVERNIAGMQAYCDEHGIALRPHIKTHKLPQVARLQVDAGARGITCQKLGEAEVLADAGFDDILISFPLVGEAKGERLAALAGRVTHGGRGRLGGGRGGALRGLAGTGSRWSSSSSATRASGGLVFRASDEAVPWLRSSRGSTGCASPAS